MEPARPRPAALANVVDLAEARDRAASRAAPVAEPGKQAQFEGLVAVLGGYLKPADIERVAQAFAFSEAAHQGQMRASGEEYITHPLAVAAICASWKLDAQAILAALLHDVVEDTGVTKEHVAQRFGAPVAELVDGVSKLDRIEFQSQEDAQAENFRKMLLAMARDVRVMLVKLADRLHNMRTLSALKSPKRRRIARETLEIHAPIAHRLGLNQVYRELQDLSLANLYPHRFAVISKAVRSARGNRREGIGKILETIQRALPEAGINAQVYGREKHLYGIYRKMVEKRLTFSQVLDIYGFRVVVPDVASCYLALGALHSLYKPVPGKFKDYIAIPKVNGYQSLHTTLIGPYGTPVEMQIRTAEMHRIAEAGVAAHWLYKSDDASISEVQKKTHKWLQSLLDIQSNSRDPAEFLEHVKVDLFPDEVYVFTPKGRIMALPRGATAVDFAYMVHTDVGDQTVAAKINGEPMPLRTELKNGDLVEIITSPGSQPNPGWLGFVRTGKARAHIRHYMKTVKYEESVGLGQRLLGQALRSLGVAAGEIDSQRWERVVRDAGAKSRQDLYADIGLGKRLAAVVARKLAPAQPAESVVGDGRAEARNVPVTIRGADGMAVQLARCCRPIPGDPIIGHISKGQGLVIHTHDCKTIAKSRRKEPDNWVDVDWDPEPDKHFNVGIRALVTNGRGILAKVAAEITAADTNITNVHTEDDETGNYAIMEFAIDVADRAHLARVMRSLRRLQEVVRINRVK
ncbi:MAG: bifunctional (p)ppGpp synthetase/guanosine-3',5'-bis(diphosphate) 3'-pyrophosphohydrolase [Burkholderiales bacterium]|nr:bifunctional (p)ppGpp synthetase/guanosine-3',5'-bis(diphosphate) 3'-pyrophosphohydrolase [Burkholderiales bacterium]